MKIDKAKKLTLNRTLIRNLTTEDLSRVGGGEALTCGCNELNPQPLPP